MACRGIIRVLVVIFAFTGTCVSAARADIGEVGSPMVSSDPPPADNAVNDNPAATPENPPAEVRTPLLIIKFDRDPRWWRVLKWSIAREEEIKANAVYDVVYISNAPPTPGRDGLDAIVNTMQRMGIPSWRIRGTTQSSSVIADNEAEIFVK